MRQRLELFFQRLLREEKKSFFTRLLQLFLTPFGLLWRLLMTLRNKAYEKNWMRKYYPPVPAVISIGNIAMGGTGKTPFTLFLAEELIPDYSVAILSRGYRSKAEKLKHPVILSHNEGHLHQASYCGDEPYLLAKRLPKARVFVGRNRKKSAELASTKGADIIIMDDALQHRKLARDFDVIILNAQDPHEKIRCFPRGFFREGTSALKRADLLVINQVEDIDHFILLKEKLSKKFNVPIIGTKMLVQCILNIKTNEMIDVNRKKVGMFCGIARPDSFRKTIENLGAAIVKEKIIGDHAPINNKEFCSFMESCKNEGVEYVICTEKDKVKLNTDEKFLLPIGWMDIKLELVSGEPEWNNFLAQVKEKVL